jgi:hypothetical protein
MGLLGSILFVQQGEGTGMEAHVNNVATKTGISPAIIQAIIAAIMSMISGCNPTPTPALLKTGGNGWGSFVIRRAVRSVGIKPWGDEGTKIHDAILAEGTTLSDDEAATFVSLCQPD